jgi:hypothetical protein
MPAGWSISGGHCNDAVLKALRPAGQPGRDESLYSSFRAEFYFNINAGVLVRLKAELWAFTWLEVLHHTCIQGMKVFATNNATGGRVS